MLTIIYYSLQEYLAAKLKKRDFRHSDVYKSYKLWKSKNSDRQRKTLIFTLLEANKLSRYWHCFPDAYFRFGMFMKDFGDMELMKSFVPQGAYYRYSADKEPKYHILIDDKILFHTIMTMYGLPVPRRFFVYQYGSFVKNGKELSDKEVDKILDSISDNTIFIKRYRGGAGSGVSIASKKEDGSFYLNDGTRLTSENIRDKFKDSNYIFEKKVVQIEILNQFNADSVNTIRVLTYKNKCVSAAVRFGGKGDFCDNVSKGGVAVSIDLETGQLGDYGMRMYDISKYYEHPDSHMRFKDVIIPNWKSIVQLVNKTTALLPYYNSVGFDIALTVEGPVIIEINTGAGIGLSQMGKKKGIAEKFKKLIIDEKQHN